MGVPGFFSWLLRKNRDNKKLILADPKNIKKHKLLLIDTNCLLHPCVNFIIDKVKQENRVISRDQLELEIFQYIESYIDMLIKKTNSSFVYIAIDGVAPMAKILQQRQRRYKYLYDKEMKLDYVSEEMKVDTTDISKYPVSSIEITPGTPFMERIDNFMKSYLKKLDKRNIKYIYSSYQIQGEGEHKLLNYIKKNIKNSQVIVYGLDADLLFLTLSVDEKLDNDIYVMREKQVFDNKEIDYEKEIEFNYVCIEELRHIITLLDMEIPDFILLCYTIGNDFLPHIKSLDIKTGGLDKIITVYGELCKQYKKRLYENNKINHNMLKMIMSKLVWTEKHVKSFKRRLNEGELDISELKIVFENKTDYYKYYLGIDHIDEEIIKEMVITYISGFDWCIEYYTNECKSWSWGYTYLIPPLLEDIVKYYPQNIKIKEDKCQIKPIEQLLIAIPRGTYDLVIEKDIINKVINNKNIGYLFPMNYNIEINKEDIYWKFPVKIPLIGELEYKEYIQEMKNINIVDYKNKLLDTYDTNY